MRIHLKITSNNTLIPYNYGKLLTGTIHKWVGKNNLEHGKISLYSFSMIQGCESDVLKKGLYVRNNGSFFISAYDSNLLQVIIQNIQNSPDMFLGLRVNEIIIQNDPDFTEKDLFYLASPVLIKRKTNETIKHFVFSDKESNTFLKETILTKMEHAGITDETLDIRFDNTYAKAKTKLIHYGNIKNKTSICPIIIKGKAETKAFIWNVGIGNSTGIGFGALK